MKAASLAILALAAMALTGAAPQAQPDFITKTWNGRKYALWLPPGYDPNRATPYPTIIFLHGIGERGTDGVIQTQVGIGPQLKNTTHWNDYIVILPQCDPSTLWITPSNETMILGMLDQTKAEENVDNDRVYLTGLSMGGIGTWTIIGRHPAMFAAAAPICGSGSGGHASELTNLPIWAFHGTADATVAIGPDQAEYDAIRAAGGTKNWFTAYVGIGHNSWDLAYGTTERNTTETSPSYQGIKLWDWFLQYPMTTGGGTPGTPAGSSGLSGYWKLDETTGPSADSSGNGIGGTWANGPTPFAPGAPAIDFTNPGCLSFNGVNQYVNLGNPSSFPSGTSARTICGWAKSNTTAAGYRWVLTYGTPATDQAMILGMNGTTLYGGGYSDDLTVAGFWDMNWHHVALTYDGTTARLYADGTERVSAAKTWNLVQGAAYIGRQVNGAGEYWNGLIDDVRVYSRALTAAEIAALAAGSGGPATPTNLQATAGNAKVSLTWSAATGASSYRVKRATIPGGPYTTIAGTASTSYTNTGLTNGTVYYYVVSAVSFDEGSDSTPASATPTSGGGSGTPPSTPAAGSGERSKDKQYCGMGSADRIGLPFLALAASLAMAGVALRRKSA